MLSASRLRTFVHFLCLAAFVFALPAFARDAHPPFNPRHIDVRETVGLVDLSANWLAHPGDDIRYADPHFDDTSWPIVASGRKLSSYGFGRVNFIWYRTHVTLPRGQKDISLLMRAFGGSYQIFVNGVIAGSSGRYPPGGSAAPNFDETFAVPPALIATGDVTIAIRASVARSTEYGMHDGGFASYTSLLLGPTAQLTNSTRLFLFRNYTSNTLNILIELLVPLIALALALTLPKEREYLALVISGAAGVAVDISAAWQSIHNVQPGYGILILGAILNATGVIASLEFVRLALGLRRSRLWIGYEWLLAFMILGPALWINHFFLTGSSGPTSGLIVAVGVVAQVISLPFSGGLPLLALIVWWRRRNPDGLLLFVPLFLSALVGYCEFGLFLFNRFHWTERTNLPAVPSGLFFMQWREVASILFSVSLLLFLVLRTVRIARSRASMASDLHAVQSVQEILLARASHDTPGFRVEHVYHPASEVGGDFFLVSPGPGGSLTAIVGDVSGKGLVAAMRVSMILGVLRREENREPSTILRNLNDALMMQGEMGFTTACCVRLEADGRYTIANAGHINPYIGGEEIPTPASLPLGLSDEQVYEQVSGYMPDGKNLVLMSDGVVEARSAKGELYGFDRLPQLTMMSAVDIADVARRFGQEDDITVLTVACGA